MLNFEKTKKIWFGCSQGVFFFKPIHVKAYRKSVMEKHFFLFTRHQNSSNITFSHKSVLETQRLGLAALKPSIIPNDWQEFRCGGGGRREGVGQGLHFLLL